LHRAGKRGGKEKEGVKTLSARREKRKKNLVSHEKTQRNNKSELTKEVHQKEIRIPMKDFGFGKRRSKRNFLGLFDPSFLA